MYGQVSTKEKKMERKETNTRDRKKKNPTKTAGPCSLEKYQNLIESD